jgi:hypothetical protein
MTNPTPTPFPADRQPGLPADPSSSTFFKLLLNRFGELALFLPFILISLGQSSAAAASDLPTIQSLINSGDYCRAATELRQFAAGRTYPEWRAPYEELLAKFAAWPAHKVMACVEAYSDLFKMTPGGPGLGSILLIERAKAFWRKRITRPRLNILIVYSCPTQTIAFAHGRSITESSPSGN